MSRTEKTHPDVHLANALLRAEGLIPRSKRRQSRPWIGLRYKRMYLERQRQSEEEEARKHTEAWAADVRRRMLNNGVAE